MYPLKFERHLIEKIWGGRKFETALNITLPDGKLYGESWEVSVLSNGMSIVSNGSLKGRSLQSLVDQYGDELLGKGIIKHFEGQFPLLIKYLDINDKLSVQVHPDDAYAQKNREGNFGKSECWYVLEADENAKLILGTREDINRANFLEKFNHKPFDQVFNVVSIKKGDFISIPPGMVHASLEGSVLICEIQQNSDLTYRIYDFDRLENGKLRPLHLDKALEVIDFSLQPLIVSEQDRSIISYSGYTKEILSNLGLFHVEKITVDNRYNAGISDVFRILSVQKGTGTINSQNLGYKLSKGDVYFIPAGLDFSIDGTVEMLHSWINL